MVTKKVSDWIYIHTPNNDARFVLGERGSRPLICFGINSSTAHPDQLDNTVRRVRSLAITEGFDGWVMLNIYPQRATNPDDMDTVLDKRIHSQNLIEIEKIFKAFPKAKTWSAWGDLIGKRSFLMDCLKDIEKVIGKYSPRWIHRESLTVKGHPRHPLYLKKNSSFHNFNMQKYLDLENGTVPIKGHSKR